MSELLEAVTQTEGDVRGLSFFDEDLYGQRVGHVEFEDCTFESCSFADLRADRIVFDRCTFIGCDFSNARMATSYWRDCRIVESRLVGCDLHQGIMVRVSMRDSICSYVNLTEGKLEQVSLQACDLHEASLAQLRLKRLTLEACDLTRAEVFGTRLRGVDLSTCQIAGIRLSNTFAELRGAKIGLDQAPDLVRLLGVTLA
jgi:uncharacterized protein YjbI with pentapeptide repeats